MNAVVLDHFSISWIDNMFSCSMKSRFFFVLFVFLLTLMNLPTV